MPHSILCALFLSLVAASSYARQAQVNERLVAAERHFIALCAPCHGESGDGRGTTQLDRPARSFREGGFSYGNTLEALYRSITTGIPGTPMPSFEATTGENERRALAEYVLSLGPADTIADTPDKVFVVGSAPRIVRGKLPPIAEGQSAWPRGLLIGTSAGTSFEYRVDDVRLLAVRAGEFVERRDWVGRGGDELLPLGKLVHSYGGGNPRASFARLIPRDQSMPFGVPSGAEEELRAELAGTWTRGPVAGLTLRARTATGEILAVVEEALESTITSVGSGWTRRFHFSGGSASGRLVHRFADDDPPETRLAAFVQAGDNDALLQWTVAKRAEGGFEARGLQVSAPPSTVRTTSASAAWLDLAPGARADLTITTLLLPNWSTEVQAALMREVLAR